MKVIQAIIVIAVIIFVAFLTYKVVTNPVQY